VAKLLPAAVSGAAERGTSVVATYMPRATAGCGGSKAMPVDSSGRRLPSRARSAFTSGTPAGRASAAMTTPSACERATASVSGAGSTNAVYARHMPIDRRRAPPPRS
jgi:hypothetical protein